MSCMFLARGKNSKGGQIVRLLKRRFVLVVLMSVVLSALGQVALGTWVPGPHMCMVSIEVSNEQGSGKFEAWFPPGQAINGRAGWSLPAAAIANGQGTPIANIQTVDITYDADPMVSLDFAVIAGISDTTFTITTAAVSFDPLVNPDAYASATATVTDTGIDGATMTGLQTGAKLYEARYNGSVAWADLIDSISAGLASSETGDGRRPLVAPNMETIPDTVVSIEAQYKFVLSAEDFASGTSTFEVVPEPATLILLGIGAMMLRRKR